MRASVLLLPLLLIPLAGLTPRAATDERAVVLSPASVPMLLNDESCGTCHCCDQHCNQIMAHEQAGGFSKPKFCSSTSCSPGGVECYPEEGENPEVQLSTEDLARLWNGAIDGEIDVISELLEAYPKQIQVNTRRGALQVVKCGNYIANIPLVPRQLAALASP